MKKVGIIACLLLAVALPLGAQVSVEVTLEQDQFLPSESIQAAVRITNRSGQALRMGETSDWLVFVVESKDGFLVARTSEPDVAGEFELPNSKVATKRVDIAPCFRIVKTGRYSVTATVRVKEWDQQISSKPKNFDIIRGTRLWEQEFGLGQIPGDANSVPEVRKYVLQQANYLKSQVRLYARITDSTGERTYKVLPVGPMVSFSRPEAQVDGYGNLHVLYQQAPRLFSYTVMEPMGEVVGRQTFEYSTARPRLKPASDGKIGVEGGMRIPKDNDIPPTPPPEPLPLKPADTGTNSSSAPGR